MEVPRARTIHGLGVGVVLAAENFANDSLPLSDETKTALAQQADIFMEEIK